MKPKFHNWDDVTEYISTLQSQRDELVIALTLLTEDPITSGSSAYYRDDCAGAYNSANIRTDPLANARALLAKIAEGDE